MLRINQQSNAAAAKSYYSSPAGYYRHDEQRIVGLWGGGAAIRLDLTGEVLGQHFERLCDNRHPFTGDQLTARMRKDRRVGYDFTFDASKSVSILYGITDDPAILDAFRWAIRATMDEMEEGVKTRVRKHGQFAERIVGNMAWGEFIDFTARPVKGKIDPHLHGHCFVPNLCWDHVEKTWKAIDVASIKAEGEHWQRRFQRRFGKRLAELGYSVVWKGDNFEIAGISREMIERFSLRTAHINHTAEKRGITDPRAKNGLGALTRERKQKDATMPQLRAEWRQRLTDDDRAAIAQAARKRRWPVPGFRQRQGDPLAHPGGWDSESDTRQRQRIAAHERARATHTTARPAPPPSPRQGRGNGYGR